jgi:hypothetical protein
MPKKQKQRNKMPVNRSIEEEKYAVANNFGDDFDVNARPAQATSGAIKSGWDAAESMTTPSGSFPIDFKASETLQVVKFLDEGGPFATYKQHFLTNKPGKKSYICLQPSGQECPLCKVLDHRADDKRAFTIVNLSAEGGPQRQILTATPPLFRTLLQANSSPQGPINKNYWAVSRTGEKAGTTYHVNAIKARDLDEDWGINQADAEAFIATVEVYDDSVIRETPYDQLLEIAESLRNS